jgi:hypothetical protein
MDKVKMISYDQVTEYYFREKQVPTMIRRGWTIAESTNPKPTTESKENGDN